MEKTIKGFLVDIYNEKRCRVVEFVDTLENIYELLNVETIDVTERKIGNSVYDIVCDDEGLLKEVSLPSAFDSKKQPQLVGNLLLVNHNSEGDFESLTEGQIEELESHLAVCGVCDNKNEYITYQVLMGVEYA